MNISINQSLKSSFIDTDAGRVNYNSEGNIKVKQIGYIGKKNMYSSNIEQHIID